jgi:inosine-uridine nucleoside N-ribohydrolase
VPVALVPTGPLSNVAAALAADPGIVDGVGRLVVLGGTHRQAGATPYAERNVWCDPEAAHDVLAAGFRDVLLVTMDATFSAPFTRTEVERLRAVGTPAASAAADLVEHRLAIYGGDAPLHDPLAVAALVDPDLLTVLRASVEVERRDPTTYGATRFRAEPDGREGTVDVAVAADRDRYIELLCEALA